jgi:hypothetical protein
MISLFPKRSVSGQKSIAGPSKTGVFAGAYRDVFTAVLQAACGTARGR